MSNFETTPLVGINPKRIEDAGPKSKFSKLFVPLAVLATGIVGQATQIKAEGIEPKIGVNEDTTVLVNDHQPVETPPSLTPLSEQADSLLESKEFNDKVNSYLEEINQFDFSKINSDSVKDIVAINEARGEFMKIINDFSKNNLTEKDYIIKLLDFSKENIDKDFSLVSLYAAAMECYDMKLTGIGNKIFLTYLNTRYNFKKDSPDQEKHFITTINQQARVCLDKGNVAEAIAVYESVLGEAPKGIRGQLEINIQALRRLPAGYDKLSLGKRRVRELAFSRDSEREENLAERYIDIEKLVRSLEEEYSVKIDKQPPILMLDDSLKYSGIYKEGTYPYPDTVFFKTEYFVNKKIADNITIEGIPFLGKATRKCLATHELAHHYGGFYINRQDSVYGKFMSYVHEEGLTDLIARYENLFENFSDIGYPIESGLWANLCYIIGHDVSKTPEECFHDGLKIVGNCFLGNHDLGPIREIINKKCQELEITEPYVEELFDKDFSKDRQMMIHSFKFGKILNLASELGIDLKNNRDNLEKLGISEGDCDVVLQSSKK